MEDLDDDGYMYLGILELDHILKRDMEDKVMNSYLKCLKEPCDYHQHMNCYCSAPALKWTRAEIDQLDRIARKTYTLHSVRHPKANLHRLCMKKCKDRLISIQGWNNNE